MTTLTSAATPAGARNPRLADLAWNAWRQHRLTIIGLAAVFACFATWLLRAGLPGCRGGRARCGRPGARTGPDHRAGCLRRRSTGGSGGADGPMALA
jgi:hypothetical protein